VQLKATGRDERENFTLNENYDSTKKTKIIVHGWKNKYFNNIIKNSQQQYKINEKLSLQCSLNSDAIQVIKAAYLTEPEDYNIIAVDWGAMADDNNYLKSAGSTREVGKSIAAVINHMAVNHNAKLKDFHLIGHSLGAHTGNIT
jgi:Lipase